MISSVDAFIEAMGGAKTLRERLGVTPQAIWQAKKLNRLPIRWTVTLADDIKRKRISLDPSLFGMDAAS